ncbi:MAG TPA: hypothetical protein VGQ72_16100 [Pyrinomonadaceae bacterium]|jgi:hypothetical protein|nr:hypothetical protein [Pyrinomonadaceae bacterium]
MYRRPKFLTVLIRIREIMSREADYDVDLFTEIVRSGVQPEHGAVRNIRGFRKHVPRQDPLDEKEVSAPRRAAR